MKTARVFTPWGGDGRSKATAYRSQLEGAFTLLSCVDVTSQPARNIIPAPNLYTVEITCDDATMTTILADAIWGPRVLWSK